MNSNDEAPAALTPVDRLSLGLVLLTGDEPLARRLDDVCRQRKHRFMRLDQLRHLRLAIPHAPAVLMLDLGVPVADCARIAMTVAAVHDEIPIVLAAERRTRRSESGFRVVDKRWSGERIVDELELAHIGIPVAVGAVWG